MWDQVGPKPLQISEINSTLDSAGVRDSETRMKYLRLMKRMDMVELSHLHEQMKRARNK